MSASHANSSANSSGSICGAGEVATIFGCVPYDDESTIFINTNKLVWVNTGAQLIVLFVGVLDFVVGSIYFYIRRRRNEERLERSRTARQSVRINEDDEVPQSARPGTFSRGFIALTPSPLKPVSDLNGQCCGCGAVADTVLLPCKHAVCCYNCSERASFCPFCKEPSTDRQRLYAV